jgi:hypothetical protein
MTETETGVRLKLVIERIKPFQLQLQIHQIGRDLLLILTGGSAHIGAVALGQSYGNGTAKSNASVIGAFGHKEDQLSGEIARYVSKKTGQRCSVVAGIHFDNLSRTDILMIQSAVQEMVEQALQTMAS